MNPSRQYPCRVSAELRIKQAEDEAAVKLYDLAEKTWEAAEIIHDGEKLKQLLNDEELAQPIAEALSGLQQAIYETGELDVPITKLVLNRLGRLEKILLDMAMGEV